MASAGWLAGSRISIDGFAGLTQQQLRMMVALARRAEHVDFALLLDPTDAEQPPDEFSLFARTERTWAAVARTLREANVPIEQPVNLGVKDRPRFARAPTLGHLERSLFRTDVIRPLTEAETAKSARYESQRHATLSAAADRGSDQAARAIRLVSAPDRRGEVRAAVRAVMDLVQSPGSVLRFRDIAIVVRDLEPYHDLISAALAACRIPFFIDRRRPTYHHPLVQLVRAVLAMHGDTLFDQTVAALLKTGLSGLRDETADAMENYALAHGLSTAAAWEETWTFPLPGVEVDAARSRWANEQLAAMEGHRQRFRDAIGEWWPTEAGKKGRPACKRWVARLYALLERVGVARQLDRWCADAAGRGELDEAEEHQQVWADLMKLLDELASALGEEPMTGRQFRDVLESGLSQLTLGLVPATLDQVLVSSIERSRHPPVRAVFVLGFGDGQFPARVSEDTILADEERGLLEAGGVELARTRPARLLDERMLAYIALTRPSDFLWVSYSQSDERGRELEPSPYWTALRAAVPEVVVEEAQVDGPASVGTVNELAAGLAEWARQKTEASNEQEATDANDAEWMALYEWARGDKAMKPALAAAMAALADPPPARLSAESAKTLWTKPLRTSVTALEQFAWCPFQHFAARGLRLAERARHEIAAMDMGRLYHRVLEQFVNEMIEAGRPLGEFSEQQIAESLERICRLAVPEQLERIRLEEREKRFVLWRGRTELPPALRGAKAALARTALRPLMTERAFGLEGPNALPALELKTPDGRTVLLRGKIDRVDIVKDGRVAVVFDYKRAAGNRLRLDAVFHGLALQLLSYLLVLRELGSAPGGAKIIPGGAFYLPLLAGLTRVDSPADVNDDSSKPFQGFRPRGIVDFDALTLLDPTFQGGRCESFAAHKKDDGQLGDINRVDAVSGEQLPRILDYVRTKLGKLADRWLDGDIEVTPARLGRQLPCTNCVYRGVCRFEYSLRQTRILETLNRSEVLKRIDGGGGNA